MDYTARMPSPAIPMTDPNTGIMTPAWFRYFLALFNRTGDAEGVGVADLVKRTGDTLLGPLTLAGDPTAPLAAATKQYVDTLPTTGSALLTWPRSIGADVKAGTIVLVLLWPWAFGSIVSLAASCAVGSFIATIAINGIAVPGLSGILVSGLAAVTTIARPNALKAGDELTVTISAITASNADFTTDFSPTDFATAVLQPTDATLQVNYYHQGISATVVGGFTKDFSPIYFVVPQE